MAEKRLLLATVGVIFLAAAAAFWGTRFAAPPSVIIPASIFPRPNAFDDFAAAGRALVERKPHDPRLPADIPLPEARHVVAANAIALKTLRAGFGHEYLSPPMRSLEDKASYLGDFRDLARVLVLDGRVKAARGDWSGAVGSSLDAVQLGQETPRGNVILGDLVGIACGAIGRRPAWEWVTHLSAKEARAAAKRLERITAHPVSFADVLTEEKWFGRAVLLEVYEDPQTFGEAERALERNILVGSQSKVTSAHTRFMGAAIARARLPYTVAAKLPPLPEPKDMLNAIVLPAGYVSGVWKHADNQAQNAMLLLTLALRAYKLEHGAYPETLTRLTPGYVKAIPDDPFANSGPLRYKRTATGYALYSVGPDGQDDGGRAIRDYKPTAGPADARNRYFVKADSKGDIVPDVNP